MKLREKTTATLLIAIFMIAIFAVAVPVFALPDEVWVDDDGPVDPTHFLTIQEGVDAVAEGGTVHVAAGIYQLVKYGEIKITDKSLTLLGAQADVPIVDSQRAGEESIIRGEVDFRGKPRVWCLIRIEHSDVVVNGFTIENGKRGIAIQGVGPDGISNIRVSYNHVEGIWGSFAGISRDDAAVDVTIDHNYIASNPRGISTRGGGTAITDNTFYGNGKGIDFLHGDPTSMYFTDYDQPNYPTIISGNTFTNDRTSIKLSLRGHQSITITGNDITEARTVAIETSGWGEDLVNPAIHYNNIWDNEFGINNQVTSINLDATLNWWGDASGPSGVGSGSGDAVSADVDYDPWLSVHMCNDIAEHIDNHGVANSLNSKIQNAFNALEIGETKDFENILNAFINQVEAQNGKKIDDDYADTLIAWAEAWIATLV